MKRFALLTFVFLLLAGVIGGFAYFQFVLKPQFIKEAIAKAPRPPATVAATVADTETWTNRLPAIGTVTAVQGTDVSAEVGGIVSKIHFKSGDAVKKGAPLLQLDDTVERADLKSGLAQLHNADLTLARQRSLFASKNVSKATLDSAQADRDTAAAALEKTRAVIAQKAITAPFAGRLGIRKVDVGQYISPGTALVALEQLDPIYVDFPVPEQNIGLIKAGQPVEVTIDALPGEKLTGKVRSRDIRVDQNTRNFLVRAVIANPKEELLPGMFANVTVLVGEPRRVVTVPQTAVTYSLYGDSIYVVAEPKTKNGQAAGEKGTFVAERRFVRVGESRGDRVEITEGIKTGDRVVTTGQIKLRPGSSIRITSQDVLKAPKQLPRE